MLITFLKPLPMPTLMKKVVYHFFSCLFFLLPYSRVSAQSKELGQLSPNQHLGFYTRENSNHEIEYRIDYKSIQIINWSPLGFVLSNGKRVGSKIVSKKVIRDNLNENLPWPFETS